MGGQWCSAQACCHSHVQARSRCVQYLGVTLAPAKKQPRPAVPAAIGIRVHSGWAALVAISETRRAVRVVDRRKIEVVDPRIIGATQPYHFAEKLEVRAAEIHIEKCAAVAVRLAEDGLGQAVNLLRDTGFHLFGAVILLSASRPLPPLPKILASHAMIHAAEGEFFRNAFRRACQNLGISVLGIRERDLDERADAAFGKAASQRKKEISQMGRTLGPPWTQDQKGAALAASILLANEP